MTEHTPTPWSIGNRGRSVIREVPGMADGHDDYIVAVLSAHSLLPESEAKANAAFIVKAVNSHERMFEALMEIRRIANEPGDRRALVDKIYGIATEGCRIPSAVSRSGDSK